MSNPTKTCRVEGRQHEWDQWHHYPMFDGTEKEAVKSARSLQGRRGGWVHVVQSDGTLIWDNTNKWAKTHQVVDFGPGPLDCTRGYPFEGTEQQCSEWLDKHQQPRPDGKGRFAIQEIPPDPEQ